MLGIALDDTKKKVLVPEDFHIGDVVPLGPC